MSTEPSPGSGNSPPPKGRLVVAQTFVSMDGVMQAPGGPEEDTTSGFQHGGWGMPQWNEEMGQEMATFMSEPAEMLLGRRTYDIFAAYWPNHRNEFGATAMNGTTKHVASRSGRRLEWENSKLLPGDAVEAVRRLKGQPGLPLHVVGSGDLLQSLFRHDLVDRVDLWVFPVVVGSGKRLFDHGAMPTAWRLLSSKAFGTGVVVQRYERAGPITYGPPPGS